MLETNDDLSRLQALLDASHARSTEHLRSIIHDDRVLSAAHVAALLTGMKVVSVATVTASSARRRRRCANVSAPYLTRTRSVCSAAPTMM